MADNNGDSNDQVLAQDPNQPDDAGGPVAPLRPAVFNPENLGLLIRAVSGCVLQASPGATPGAEVGSTKWMEILFPPSEKGHTLTFGKNKETPATFDEEFLMKHFHYFTGCLSSSTVESAEKTTNITKTTGDAFAIIIAYLIVGAFPKVPVGGPTPTKSITDRLEAVRLTDYLGLKTKVSFYRLLEADVRQILMDDRTALAWEHLDIVFAETGPDCLEPYIEIFASAAVKPFLCGWMREAKRETIEASVAGQFLQENPFQFKKIIRHYDQLASHLDYQTEVFKLVHQAIHNSKRLNKLAIEGLPAYKKLKNLPDAVDHVTYQDPLPMAIGSDNHLFTI